MKRKLINLGQSLAITLPKPWVDANHLTKGAELDINIHNNLLQATPTNTPPPEQTITIDVRKLTPRVIHWALSGLHKQGYDTITIYYDNNDVLNTIHERLRTLFVGFTILEQTPTRIILKSITTELPTEFDNTLRRSWLITLNMAEATLEYIQQNKLQELQQLLNMEESQNQLSNFCERILNKNLITNKSHFWYIITWNLEKVCDEYKYICRYLHKNHTTKIHKETLNLFKITNDFLRQYYELFYNFNIDKLVELHETRKKIHTRAEQLIGKLDQHNTIILHHLLSSLSSIIDFSTSTIALRYEPKQQ